MKALFLPALAVLLFAGCDLPESSAIADAKAAVDNATAGSPAAPVPSGGPTETNSVATPPGPVPDLPQSLPEPAREVVRLAHGQVGDSVITNFVANIREPFHLDANQVVYLRDLGLSPTVLESLLSREQELAGSIPSSPTPVPAAAPSVEVAAASASRPTVYPGGPTELAPPQVGPAVTVAPAEQTAAAPATVNNNFFYNSLAPFGNWITVPSFGSVWQPSCAVVDPGWRPYWNGGCWNWCDAGWFWNSSYSWGWAPFHYGNWVVAPGRGWCWVPGQTWAASWVTFRSGGGFCGWAPLPPGCGWSSGIGLTWAGSGVSVGFGFGFGAANYCWTPARCFTAPNCSAFGVSGSSINQIYNNSTVINNYVVGNNNTIINNGIDPAHLAPYTRGEIRKAQLADVNSPSALRTSAGSLGRPGNSTQLAVYRPAVGGVSSANASPGARSEVRPSAQFASRGSSDAMATRIPGRPLSGTQPDRMPAPNPRTPSVGLPAGSGVSSSSSALSGRSGPVRPATGGGSSLGTVSRPTGARNPVISGGQDIASRGGASYSPATPSGRLEPRKAPSAPSIADRAPGASMASPGSRYSPSDLSPQRTTVRSPVGTGRPAPGSAVSTSPRSNPRPSLSAPMSTPNYRPSQAQQIPRMQSAPSMNMSRPMPSFNTAPNRGGGGIPPGGAVGGGLQRPGR